MSDEPTRARPQMPRIVAIIIVAAIAVASIAALFWPKLGADVAYTGPTEVGVIRRLVDSPSQAARIGDAAPDFEWNAPDGKTRRLSGLRGQVVVINFWATWCVPCRTEMPALQRVAGAATDAVFLAVNLEEPGSTARPYLDTLGLDRLTPLLDLDGQMTRRYGVIALPQIFFIDAAGIVRHIERGQVVGDDEIWRGMEKARAGASSFG